MANDVQPERRKSYCPTCKTNRGTPRGVWLTDGIRTVDYKCLICRTEWKVQDDSTDSTRLPRRGPR